MNFDYTKLMIWQGANQNLLKLTGGKPKFPQIIGAKICHEGLKPKKSSNYKDEIKKKKLQGRNRK